jgi:type IV pilus assembly protein PilE
MRMSPVKKIFIFPTERRFVRCKNKNEVISDLIGDLSVFPRTRSGFTLIELLVVVLIIGILASVALPQYQLAVTKSRYAALKHVTKSLADAEEAYYMANGTYTEDMEALAAEPSGCQVSSNRCLYSWGYCSLRAGNVPEHSVHCERRERNNAMMYMIYLDYSPAHSGRRMCLARNRDVSSVENRICKAETGASPGTGTTGSYTYLYPR